MLTTSTSGRSVLAVCVLAACAPVRSIGVDDDTEAGTTDAEVETDDLGGTESDTPVDTDTDVESDAHVDSDTDPDTVVETDPDTEVETDADTEAETDADTDTMPDTEGVDTEVETDVDTDTVADTDVDTDGGGFTGICGSDAFEPNNTWLTGTLLAVPPNGAPQTYAALEHAPGDIDYFDQVVPAGCSFTAEITFAHASKDLDLSVHEAGSYLMLDMSDTTADVETVSFTNTRTVARRVWFVVYTTEVGCVTYDLEVVVGCP